MRVTLRSARQGPGGTLKCRGDHPGAAGSRQWPLTWGPSGVGVGGFLRVEGGFRAEAGGVTTCTGSTCRGARGRGQLRPGLLAAPSLFI